MTDERDLVFWLRWVLGNLVGEGIGLGTTFAVGFSLLSQYDSTAGLGPALLVAGVSVLLGLFEGVTVGLAQWSVLRRRLPGLSLGRWVAATTLGAFLAWALAMAVVTIVQVGSGGAQSAAPEAAPPDAVIYLMAAGMGAVLGPVLAVAQWPALRPWVARAWRWIPANAAAWLIGMPVVFVGVGSIPNGAGALQAVLTMLVATALMGAVVGAVHGAVLVRVLLPERLTPAAPGPQPGGVGHRVG